MKNLLLISITMFCLNANSQITVWEDDFNNGEAADWTLLDVDANTSNWVARKNIKIDENAGVVIDGNMDVLASYNMDLTTLSPYANPENNWAITPAQDLSFYAGTVKLDINAQIAEYSGSNESMLIYISESEDVESFLENEPVTINLSSTADTGEEFQEFTVDLAAYAGTGKPEVYIAFVIASRAAGIEINDVKISATEFAVGLEDFAGKTASKIKQNPVTETLQLQLGSIVNAETLNLEIYNVSGMLVKQVKYNETGVSVNDLSEGMYFVVLKDGDAVERLKFVKK